MSLYDYIKGVELYEHCHMENISFYSMIQCAIRKADSFNIKKLEREFPKTWKELKLRYDAPGGKLDSD